MVLYTGRPVHGTKRVRDRWSSRCLDRSLLVLGSTQDLVAGTKKVRDRWLHVSIVIITKKKSYFFFLVQLLWVHKKFQEVWIEEWSRGRWAAAGVETSVHWLVSTHDWVLSRRTVSFPLLMYVVVIPGTDDLYVCRRIITGFLAVSQPRLMKCHFVPLVRGDPRSPPPP